MTAKIEIKMDNTAFDESPASELARILRQLADGIENVETSAVLRDINGNRVGTFGITHPNPSSRKGGSAERAMSTTYAYDRVDLATILAALRHWQQSGMADDPRKRSDELHSIATCDDEETSMDSKRIDELCEALNSDFPVTAAASNMLVFVRDIKKAFEKNQHGDLNDIPADWVISRAAGLIKEVNANRP